MREYRLPPWVVYGLAALGLILLGFILGFIAATWLAFG